MADDGIPWRHPKLQALIAERARLQIRLSIVDSLLTEGSSYNPTSMTMEYWDSSHDALASVVLDAERYNRLKAIATLGFLAAPSWDAVLRIPIKDASHNTLDKIIDSHDPKES